MAFLMYLMLLCMVYQIYPLQLAFQAALIYVAPLARTAYQPMFQPPPVASSNSIVSPNIVNLLDYIPKAMLL